MRVPVLIGECRAATEGPEWPLLWTSGCAYWSQTYNGDRASACMTRSQLEAMAVFRLAYEAWLVRVRNCGTL